MHGTLVTEKKQKWAVMLSHITDTSAFVLSSLLSPPQVESRSPYTSHVRGDPGNLNGYL